MLKSDVNNELRRERIRAENDKRHAERGGNPHHHQSGGVPDELNDAQPLKKRVHTPYRGQAPPERLVRMNELRAITGLGKSTINRLIAQGRFPQRLHPLGHGGMSAWRYTEVAAWVADRCDGKAV